MAQLGFFDADKRLEALSAKGDPLEAIDRLVPWESFRAEIEAVVLTPDELKKSSAGRKPFDAILMFRMLVLQALNNLSDEQVEYQVRDRLSFSRFLGLGIEDSIPDATTLWLFREKLAKAGLIEKLLSVLTSILRRRATSRVAGRSSTPVSCRCRRSGTVVTRTTSCGLAAHQQGGSRSSPSCGRRTAMRAGPRSMTAASSATRTM
jgi:hypothetical protein